MYPAHPQSNQTFLELDVISKDPLQKETYQEQDVTQMSNYKNYVYRAQTSKHWKEGNYFLRSDLGPFAGFYVKKGGKVKLLKENQNKTPYLCWGILGTK